MRTYKVIEKNVIVEDVYGDVPLGDVDTGLLVLAENELDARSIVSVFNMEIGHVRVFMATDRDFNNKCLFNKCVLKELI